MSNVTKMSVTTILSPNLVKSQVSNGLEDSGLEEGFSLAQFPRYCH